MDVMLVDVLVDEMDVEMVDLLVFCSVLPLVDPTDDDLADWKAPSRDDVLVVQLDN